MNAPESIRRMPITTPMVVMSAMFVAAGGFIHARQWLDVYRHVPADAPGAAVVRIGFPLNAAASFLFVVALALVFRRPSRLTRPVVWAAVAFQVASLATLVATRVGSVVGWAEPIWTPAAQQTLAVEAAAIAALVVLALFSRRGQAAAGPLPHLHGCRCKAACVGEAPAA
ncbi:MAG TPA: hypothetical protein VM938_15410 [Acidimicrobiales bacterium]|nr:hypothetical protein [Acidimicrobiales bacterium]